MLYNITITSQYNSTTIIMTDSVESSVIKMLVEKNQSLSQIIETQKTFIDRLTDTCQRQQSMVDKLCENRVSLNMNDQPKEQTKEQPKDRLKELTEQLKDQLKERSNNQLKLFPDGSPVEITAMCTSIKSVEVMYDMPHLLFVVSLLNKDDRWIQYLQLQRTTDSGSWKHSLANHYYNHTDHYAFALSLESFQKMVKPYIDIYLNKNRNVYILHHNMTKYLNAKISKISFDYEISVKLNLKEINTVVLAILIYMYSGYQCEKKVDDSYDVKFKQEDFAKLVSSSSLEISRM